MLRQAQHFFYAFNIHEKRETGNTACEGCVSRGKAKVEKNERRVGYLSI